MLAEFLKELIGSVAPTEYIRHDTKVFSKEVFNPPLPIEPPYPTITVRSLDGFCDALELAKIEVVVCSARQVVALGREEGQCRKRSEYVKAVCSTSLKSWSFQPLEDFRIQLVTSFVQTPARDQLLERIATVKDEAITIADDDGITQRVSAKVGIAQVGQVGLPPVVDLMQIRSFDEVDQVMAPYLFRVRRGATGIEAALFEVQTDWETKQARLVAEFVKGKSLKKVVY